MSTALLPTAPLSLLIIQATRFCNIDCRYCYLPHRSRRDLMSDEVMDRIVARLGEHPEIRDDVTVVWHAGEPLSAGIDFYERALLKFARLGQPGLRHTIQTNGTLIDADWCRFLKERGMHLGISLDGPRHIHDAQRVTRAGKGTFDQVMRNIELVRSHDIPFTLLSVVTAKTLAHVEDLFDFYAANDFRSIGFLVEEIEGTNRSSEILGADVATMRAFWRDVMQFSARYEISVREMEQMVPFLLGPSFDNTQTLPGGIITIANNGDFSTYSPELLEQESARYRSFVIGNVARDSFAAALQGAKNRALYRDIEEGVLQCRRECSYFGVCQGGYPSNKHSENGSFASSATAHCRRFVQCRADAVLDELECYLGSRGKAATPASVGATSSP